MRIKLAALASIILLSSLSVFSQKFRINDVYYDVDDAFPNSTFVTINSVDPIIEAYGVINLETLETVGRSTYKTQSKEDNFQDSPLPFLIKKANKNEVHVAWTLKQLEKDKYFKLKKIQFPNVQTDPKWVNPNSDHSTVYLIFKSASTITLSNGHQIIPVVKSGIFNQQVTELKIYKEGRLGLSINQGEQKKSLDLFFGDTYYILADYRNAKSYLDLYPAYMGKSMVSSSDPDLVEIKNIKLTKSKIHNRIQALRDISIIQANLKDSVRKVTPKFALKSDQWVYVGDQGENGLAHGIGNAISRDGSKYIVSGYFKDGIFESGTMYSVFGEQWTGNFKEYKLNGKGSQMLLEGTMFKGEFDNGLLQGIGTMISNEGIIYRGGFTDNLFNGQGRIDVSNGDFYEGNFTNGLPHEDGLFNTNGKIEKCTYDMGRRVDRAFQTNTESSKNDYLASMTDISLKKKVRFLNNQKKRRTANNLFKQLSYTVGTSPAGSAIGINGKEILNKLPRKFRGVISDITYDLLGLNGSWSRVADAVLIGNTDLKTNRTVLSYNSTYQKEFQTTQIDIEQVMINNAALYDSLIAPVEEVETDQEEVSDDDWGWQDTAPIAPQPIAKYVWVPGYYSDNSEQCRTWKWTSYSIEFKTCNIDDRDYVEIVNKDFDPIKASFKFLNNKGRSSQTWEIELEPETSVRQFCDDCFDRNTYPRSAFVKEFELVLE